MHSNFYFSNMIFLLIPIIFSWLYYSIPSIYFPSLISTTIKLKQFYMKNGLFYLLCAYDDHILTYYLINYFFGLLFTFLEWKVSGSPLTGISSKMKNKQLSAAYVVLGSLKYREYIDNSGNSGHLIHVSVVSSVEGKGKESQHTKGNCLLYQENI